MYRAKSFALLTMAFLMTLTGCSSGVSQEDYDALLAENEALKQELAQYTGEDTILSEEAETPPVVEYDPDAAPASESDFLYVNNGSAVQINGYQGSGGYVVIPNEIEDVPVTRIAPNAFEEENTITGIVLPENLEFIGHSAFWGMENLSGVLVLPKTVSVIEPYAFADTYISGVVIQSDCLIGFSAFEWTTSLEFIYVQASCAPVIDSCAFKNAEELNIAILPETMAEIEDGAFDACNSVTIYTTAESFAEDYANRNFIKVDTARYNEQVSKYSKIYG